MSLKELRWPERAVTIGVNDIGRYFHPNYLLVVDPRRRLTEERYRYIDSSKAVFVFTDRDYAVRRANVVRFPLRQRAGPDFSNPHELHYIARPWHSPYIALHLAAHMGAARIGMIGVDFSDHHFYANTGPYEGIAHLATVEQHFRRLNIALAARGIKVFNLSARSRITAFPRLSIEDFERVPEPMCDYDQRQPYRVVCYAADADHTSAARLALSISAETRHYAIALCADGRDGCPCDLNWNRSPEAADEELRHADAVVFFGRDVDDRHAALLEGKPIIDARRMPAAIAGWTEPDVTFAKPARLTVSYRPGHNERADAELLPLLQRSSVEQAFDLELNGTAGSHVVVDEELFNGYSDTSLKALARGCVAINGLAAFPHERARFHCWAESDDLPFIHARGGSIERVLAAVLRRGGDSLVEEGAANRRWLARHWNFQHHWNDIWMPAIAELCGEQT
jgi:hypothetical protein